MHTAKFVHCPTCHKQVIWTQNSKWKPFCSERCRLIDLGAWISEGYRIPSCEDENTNKPPDEDS